MSDPTYGKLFGEVESNDFACDVLVCSGLNVFVNVAGNNLAFCKLAAAVDQYEGASETILERINQLLKRDIDLRYRNPYDAALAAYALLLLNSSVNVQMRRLISTGQNLFWAKRIANRDVE